MAFSYSPKIISDSSLVLYLDAANTRSYISGSTTWNSLSRSGNNATLFNGPGFNTSNGGNISFDGTNDYGTVQSLTLSTLANGFTWGGWVRHTNFAGSWSWIAGGSNNFAGQNYAFFQIGKISGNGNVRFETGNFYSNTFLDATNVNIADGRYHYVLGAVNLTTGRKEIYVDGLLASSTSITLNNPGQDFGYLTIGTQMRTNTTVQEFWVGNIAQVHVYNRGLSATEVLQNYNAIKSRYT